MEQAQIDELLKSKGFDSLEKMAEAFEKNKADMMKYKGEAKSATALETELQTLKDAETARGDAEKTELELLQAKLATSEAATATANAATLAATRKAMLEVGISEQIGTVHENLRGFAADYLRTVLPAQEWADPEALKATITASIEKFGEKLPDDMKVVPSSGTPPPRNQDGPAPAGNGPIFDVQKALHGQ